jgi:hypothetical protein
VCEYLIAKAVASELSRPLVAVAVSLRTLQPSEAGSSPCNVIVIRLHFNLLHLSPDSFTSIEYNIVCTNNLPKSFIGRWLLPLLLPLDEMKTGFSDPEATCDRPKSIFSTSSIGHQPFFIMTPQY